MTQKFEEYMTMLEWTPERIQAEMEADPPDYATTDEDRCDYILDGRRCEVRVGHYPARAHRIRLIPSAEPINNYFNNSDDEPVGAARTRERDMSKYRNKTVVIEAVQFTPLTIDDCEQFVGGDVGKDADGHTVFATREGAMHVSLSDWIIKGVKGEFYPCKPDIFEATYEPATAPEPVGAVPVMTFQHQGVLQTVSVYAPDDQRRQFDEVGDVIRALASGALHTFGPQTQVVVPLAELEGVREAVRVIPFLHHNKARSSKLAAIGAILDRWLSESKKNV